MISLDKDYVSEKITKRKAEAHKGDFGKVLVYAGSPGMAGAAILSARSALRSGAGLVRLLIPSMDSPLLTILQSTVFEATCVPFEKNIDYTDYDAVIAGPGLGTGKTSQDILSDILERYEGKLVLDADALNMISYNSEIYSLFKKSRADIIMTPHVGEAKRLLGKDADTILDWKDPKGRIDALNLLIQKYGCVIILKGHETLIGNTSQIFKNTTGNPGMATGGSGDVLTGIIASLCAQGLDTLTAAACAVFLHGRAGDIAADNFTEMGLISSDIVSSIPAALKEVY